VGTNLEQDPMPTEMLHTLLNIIKEQQNKSQKSGQKSVRTLQMNRDKSLGNKGTFFKKVTNLWQEMLSSENATSSFGFNSGKAE
jgi:hypothetical protein